MCRNIRQKRELSKRSVVKGKEKDEADGHREVAEIGRVDISTEEADRILIEDMEDDLP